MSGCYQCSSPAGDVGRLCPDCTAARIASRGRGNFATSSFDSPLQAEDDRPLIVTLVSLYLVIVSIIVIPYILLLPDASEIMVNLLKSVEPMDAAAMRGGVIIGAVVTIILAVFLFLGHNWARIFLIINAISIPPFIYAYPIDTFHNIRLCTEAVVLLIILLLPPVAKFFSGYR